MIRKRQTYTVFLPLCFFLWMPVDLGLSAKVQVSFEARGQAILHSGRDGHGGRTGKPRQASRQSSALIP